MPRLLAFLCLFLAAPAFAERCQLARVAEWSVKMERNRPLIEASVNGHPVGVLIDTGATKTAMTRSAADRLGLARVDAGISFYGVGGRTRAELAEIDDFRLGGAVQKKWPVLVIGEHGIDGVAIILGDDFFESFDLELDFGNKVARLYQPEHCEKAALAYWAPDAVPIKLARARSLVVDVQVNGVPLLALIDTGATRSTLDLGAARRTGITPESPGVMPGGCITGIGRKPTDAFIAPMDRFAVGDEAIRDARIPIAAIGAFLKRHEAGSLLSSSMDAPEMILGMDFLLAHRILISHSQHALYFTHNGRMPVFDSQPSPTCAERTAAPTADSK